MQPKTAAKPRRCPILVYPRGPVYFPVPPHRCNRPAQANGLCKQHATR